MEKTDSRRFDPKIHPDPIAYVESFEKGNEQNIAVATTLSGAFTPFTEEAYKILVTEHKEHGLVIPEALSGDLRVLDYETPRAKRLFRFGRAGAYDSLDKVSFPVECQYRSGKVTSNDHEIDPNGFLDLNMPIGNGGRDVALALVQATRALYTVIPDQLSDSEDCILSDLHQIIKMATYYKNPNISFVDGMKSLAESFAFITNASKIPGYENDPVGLFGLFIENGTFNKLGRILMAGDLPTIILSGWTPVDIVDPKTLTLKREFLEGMIKRQKHFREDRKFSTVSQTSYGCPVAMKNTPVIDKDGSYRVIEETGINFGARIFVEYFDHYYKEAVKPQNGII